MAPEENAEADAAPCILSSSAADELDVALAVDKSATEDAAAAERLPGGPTSSSSHAEGPPADAEPVSSSALPEVPLSDRGSDAGATTRASAARFQSRLGVLALSTVQRAGVKCLFCSGSVEKGRYRFEYAFKLSKPCRSIHTECLAQINDGECLRNSVETLRRLSSNATLEAERSICRSALATLELVG